MLDRKHATCAAEPGLHFVGDEHDSLAVADLAHALHELVRRNDEPGFALDGLENDGGDGLARNLRRERALDSCERIGGADAVVLVRERHAVDLRREGPESRLVRVCLRCERQ